MADDKASIDDFLSDEPKKKESFLPFLAALGLISVVAVGAGWIVSSQLSQDSSDVVSLEEKPAKDEDKSAEKGDKQTSKYIGDGSSQIMKLDPVLVSLADGSDTYLRMELALIFDKDAGNQNEETRLRIGSEITSFASTLTLKQISGPSGYLHLREDLLDRARLATSGEVKELLILSMVSE